MTRSGGGEPPKSAAEIEDEIRRTRAELALTLDALTYQLMPRQFIGKGIDMIFDSVGRNGVAGMKVGEAVHANRLPLALIGAGLAWLLVRNLATRDDTAPPATEPHEPRADRSEASWVHQATGAARGALRSVRDTGQEIVERAGQYAEYAARAKEPVRNFGGSVRSTFERNPLLIGVVGVISGAALALLLPTTRREQEWLEKPREELWNQAEKVGHQAAERVRDLAERKGQAADS
jgi:hypothetical protein